MFHRWQRAWQDHLKRLNSNIQTVRVSFRPLFAIGHVAIGAYSQPLPFSAPPPPPPPPPPPTVQAGSARCRPQPCTSILTWYIGHLVCGQWHFAGPITQARVILLPLPLPFLPNQSTNGYFTPHHSQNINPDQPS